MTDVDSLFDQMMGELDYPMYIITTAADGVMAGCLVGFTSQVSMNPHRFLVGHSERNHTSSVALGATHLGVHLIAARDLALARLFGEESSDSTNKFDRCDWSVGPHGVPVLSDAAASFVGRIVHRIDFGDHAGYLLTPEAVTFRGQLGPLLSFDDVRDLEAGHDA